jgi:CP family cyanate transporter-like MFS transporter
MASDRAAGGEKVNGVFERERGSTADRTIDGKARDDGGSWFLVAAMVVVAMALRPGIVSIGPVLPQISQTFHLSHAAASLLTTIPDLLMGLLALPTPWLARRFGRNSVLMASLVLLLVSMVARALSPHVAMLLVTTAGVGAGIAISGALFAGLIKAKFPGKAAAMMGIYATALSFGSTISAGATGPIASLNVLGGWRLGVGVWSLFALFAVGVWLVILRGEQREQKARTAQARNKALQDTQDKSSAPLASVAGSAPLSALPQQTDAAAVNRHGARARLPLNNATAWRVALFFACVNFLFYALISWIAPMYQETGMTPSRAGWVLASFTIVFMVANPVFGTLSKSSDRRAWLAVCAVLTGVGVLGTAISPTQMPFLWIPVAAFGLGGAFTLGMTLPIDNTRDVDEANTWNAFVLTVGYLIAAGGPLLVGALRDMTGAFTVPFWCLAAVSIAMLALTPFLAPHRPVSGKP